MERWIESEIQDGDFFVADGDFSDILKAVYHDYFATGEKILCFCDTKSVWPAKEICAEYYERMTRFEKEDIAEVIPITKSSHKPLMMKGKLPIGEVRCYLSK